MASRRSNAGGENPEFIFQAFEGMNLLDAREAINDDEFYWCENAIPVAKGALYSTPQPSASLTIVGAETGSPSYTTNFNVNGTDFCFAVWKNSGKGYIVNLTTFAATLIITGLTSGQTIATQYSNQGLLIVDPTGYWDWSVTTPNTLTLQNNAVASVALTTASTFAGGITLKNIVTVGGSRTGATFQNFYQVQAIALTAGGAGYAVGDVITFTDGNPTVPASILVLTLGGGGAIATFSILSGGNYPGPNSGALVATGPTGLVLGGTTAGVGATFTTTIKAVSATILTRGSGYVTGDVERDLTAINTPVTIGTLTSSGVISGTSIATYAGRVWIGLGRVVFFTDINSYNSFGGAGGSFTINDSYLHNSITVLWSANNYLYIFGDTSVDALSNVTITNGVTAFSRINLNSSVGTSTPTSVFSYYRSVAFYHASGFYFLSGATPEKVSEKISGLVSQILPASANVYGGEVLIRAAFSAELCAAFMFTFNDLFTGQPIRSLLALYFRRRWWVASIGALNVQAMVSVPVAGIQTIFAWAGNTMYRAFNDSSSRANWLLKTKLWDGGALLHEKQSINAAFAGAYEGLAGNTVTMQVDTEFGTNTAVPFTGDIGVAYSYIAKAITGGKSQYLGLTVIGTTSVANDVTQIRLLALRGKADRDLLQ